MEIFFYYKEDCHLCEQMSVRLNEFIAGRGATYRLKIVARDIEDDDSWFAEYREYIPVLVANGQEVCHYFFDEQELLDILKAQSPNS